MAVYEKYTDKDLLDLLKDDDHAAYAEIYARYSKLLYIFAYKRLKNREDVKDLIHELFLCLWKDRELVADRYVLAAYLYSSLRNKIINVITHKKVATTYIDSFAKYLSNVSQKGTDFLVRHNDLQTFIEKEIENLNPRTKQVFKLSRNSHLTRKEIAQHLDISEETVKSHMHGALKVLKLKLGVLLLTLAFISQAVVINSIFH